jgi:YidC/Oxa1 family membrane protein insertase
MDQMRLLIALVLSFLVFFGYNHFFGEPQQKKTDTRIQAEPSPAEDAAKAAAKPKRAEAPAAAPALPTPKPDRPLRSLEIDTPLFTVWISEQGAAVKRILLKAYRETSAKDSPLKSLAPPESSLELFRAGLEGGGPAAAEALFFQADSDRDRVTVAEGGAQRVVFRSAPVNGVQLEKAFSFAADSYAVGLEVSLLNHGDRELKDRLALVLREVYQKEKKSYAFEGPTLLIEDKLKEVPLDEIAKNSSIPGKIKWMALQSRYFMTCLVAPGAPASEARLARLPAGEVVEAKYFEPEFSLGAGEGRKFEYQLYFGPKSTPALAKAGHQLERVVDFGTFDFLAKPCVWLLNFFYGLIPNYGVAIIILTILTKIVLWPLGTKSYKSMSQMKKMQPLIQELREKYKNDRKKMNEEVMRLYRTYNINPVGGCLPMVLQIPVFFALYRMLDQAIELRHAPFLGWINDLSAPDRLFNFDFSIPFMEPPYGIPVLTLVMGATMFWQQKMSPPAGDPTQAKMMMLMPIVFTFIFINFSSGLVLYWLISNVLSIGQQYYTQKKYA